MNISQLKMQAILNISDFHYVANQLGIKFFLLDGTLLGAYRDKDFCINDEDDIDVGIMSKDYHKTKELVEELEKKYGFSMYKTFWLEDRIEGFGLKRGKSHFDVIRVNKHPKRKECYWFGRIQKNNRRQILAFVYPSKHFNSFDTLRFYGLDFLIPSSVETWFDMRYGNWKVKHDRPAFDWYRHSGDKAFTEDYDMIKE